ncbi:MAG: DNA polymerase III subunit gamma/tau [Thermoanaerobaculia bacterium]|nr:DNA polymerase III subunit gamma/tau [Thermoanaerobaculia bacterium]
MAYQVLARKWRPQDFTSVVGQQPVVQALRNALADGRIAQAYLFSGIRGVGKTSVARVFAKALNCPNEPASDPCNECTTCADITKGSDLDVLEIDAATYSKVEQVRELTDSLQYGPARDPYKVVIIDEIHRLSRQAFDALLKIVEEPPEHLVFIFATTEAEAVPATILSRCQTFQFRRVPLAQMVEHLSKVSRAEELEVSDHALRLIARASEGSVRDAIALLDQLATFGGGRIADEEVGRIVGGVELSLLDQLLRSILAGQGDEVAAFVRQVESTGVDPRHVYGQFLSYCRDALHLALDPEGARVELPSDEAAELAKQAAASGYENLLRLLNLLLASEMTVRRSEAAGLALEVTLLRAAELPKLTAIEALLGRGEAAPSAPAAGSEGKPTTGSGSAAKGSAAAPERQAASASRRTSPTTATPDTQEPAPQSEPATEVDGKAVESTPEPSPDEPVTDSSGAAPLRSRAASADAASPDLASDEEREPQPATAAAGTEETDPIDPEPMPKPHIGEGREVVGQLLERLSYVKQPLAAHLSGARSLSMRDDELIITTSEDDTVLARTLARPTNRKILQQALTEMAGPGAAWRVVAGPAGSAGSDTPEEAESEETPEEVSSDPTVQKVLDLFGGQIEAVEQRSENSEA